MPAFPTFDEEGCPLPHPYLEVELRMRAAKALQIVDAALSFEHPDTGASAEVCEQRSKLREARTLLRDVMKLGAE